MCGLFGFVCSVDTLNEEQRRKFTVAGGAGVDNRGGHASGYVSVNQKTNTIRYCKKLGRWLRAKQRFLTTAADGNILMGHARFATCGSREEVQHAHPFAVKRNGQIKLWGAHNGVISGAFEHAKKSGREIGVDSQEIFELIVDKDYEAIQKLSGYGVITWIEAAHHDYVNLVKLSGGGDIVVYTLKEGGVVWASTSHILDEALKLSDLHCDKEYKGLEVGKVYQLRPQGMYETDVSGIKLDSLYSSRSTYNSSNHWNHFQGHDYSRSPSANTASYYADTRDHDTWCRCASCLSKKASTPSNHTSHRHYTPVWEGEVSRQNGDTEWYVKDKLHRTDGPARVCKDGTQEWWINGERHRSGEPAIIRTNGEKEWYQNGKQHRLDGPALEKPNGDYAWYREGAFHREDGPAVRYAYGNVAPSWEGYYLNNKFFHNKEEFEKGLVEWKAEQAAIEAAKKNNPEEIAKAKDHAFLRELKGFWLKFDEQKEKGDDAWGKNSADPVALRNVQA